MFLRFARLLPLLGVFLAGAPLLRAAPTATDFFKRPDLSAPSISEDGRYLAYLTPSSSKYYDLNVFDFTKGEPLKFDLKGDDVISYYWLDEHQLVLSTQKRPLYWWRQAIFDLDQRKFTHNVTYTDLYYTIISALKDRPGLFYAFFPNGEHNLLANSDRPEIAIIDVKRKPSGLSGMSKSRFNIVESLSIPAGEFHGCYPDFRGEIRAVVLYTNGKLRYHFRASAKAPWTELPMDAELVDLKAFAADPDVIYVTRRDPATSLSSLHRYSVSRNEFGPALFTDSDYALDECELMMSEGNTELLGLRYYRDRVAQVALSPVLQEVQAAIGQALPGRDNLITDYDEKLTRFVVTSFTDRNVRYLTYSRGKKAFTALPEPNPGLPAAQLSPMAVVHYQTRDGLRLEGYLTLPVGLPAGTKPPLVVMPHGGPWRRDTWSFSRRAQFLASRGYAVFQPNYRGSTGYPKAISKDGAFAFRQMHEDVTDGVRYLVANGEVDPQRLAIFGGSFGGYLALCGAAFEPDLYRCALTFAGVFDWEKLIAQRGNNTTRDRFNYELLLQRLGDPRKSRALFDEISPINHIDQIKVPVFVAHGKDDETVDYAQSKKLLSELRRYHVPVETLFFENEAHGFDEEENEVKFYTTIEAFLAKNLNAAPAGKN